MLHVLILDDDALEGKLLADALRRNQTLDCHVIAVATASEARQVVEDAKEPFDVLLTDYDLGPDADGINVMRELMGISQNLDVIVFTGGVDQAAGRLAYEAGAYRYLQKPFNKQELILILQSLVAYRATKSERDWLKILTDVAEAAQKAVSLHEMGNIIVRGGQRLGYERARLWFVEEDSQILVGTSEAGNVGLEGFVDCRIAVTESPYMERVLKAKGLLVFEGQQHGESYLTRRFGPRGFQPPTGHWLGMPLWSNTDCRGILVLDNASRVLAINPERLSFLRLFGNQVAAALDRVRLYEQEQRKSQELARLADQEQRKSNELEVLAQIGQRVTNRAALVDLDTLLREVHVQVAQLIDARNFMVVLVDPDTGYKDLRLIVEDNQARKSHVRKIKNGLVDHLIEGNKPMLLPHGGERYRAQHNIPLDGRQSRCWLGVPLQVEGKAIGGIVVQNYEKEYAFTKEDERLLNAVAAQVAGAIQTVRLKEEANRDAKRLLLLQQAGDALTKLVGESAEWFWRTVLTVATASYGLRFNRAALFFFEEGNTVLHGRMGIGEFNRKQAIQKWEKDDNSALDFKGFLDLLRNNKIKSTSLQEHVCKLNLLLENNKAFQQVVQNGRQVRIHQNEVEHHFSTKFIELFGRTECAVLPLQVGGKWVGLVIVDNVHNDAPLSQTLLNQLETFLAQVALIDENHRQRQAQSKLTAVTSNLIANTGDESLQETLERICREVKDATHADSVVAYPLLENRSLNTYEYDTANIAAVGLRKGLEARSHSRIGSVTQHIFQTSESVKINDTVQKTRLVRQIMIDNTFVRREGIRSFIGAPIKAGVSGEMLGVLYINYCKVKEFTRQDVEQARLFADIAQGAIRASRKREKDRVVIKEAQDLSRLQRREILLLWQTLYRAVTLTTDKQGIALILLNAVRKLLAKPNLVVGLELREWKKPGQLEEATPEMRRQYFLYPDRIMKMSIEPHYYSGITGEALRKNEDLRVDDVDRLEWKGIFVQDQVVNTRSEVAVLIRSGSEVLGAFNAKSSKVAAFANEDLELVIRFAAAAGLVLDNVLRQEHLHNVLTAAQTITTPTDLKTTLQAIINAASGVTPGVSTLTIWYKEPETGRLLLGPSVGLRKPNAVKSDPPEGNVVWRVIKREEPIWAPDVHQEPILTGEFIDAEGIQSTGAFPLRVDDDVVGAMFLNYRQRHEFSSEDKALLPIIAAIAASGIRDAQRLELVRKERDRLDAARKITEAVGTSLALDEILRKVLETLCDQFLHAKAAVLLYNETERWLTFTPASKDFYTHQIPLEPVRLTDKSIASRIAREALETRQVAHANIPNVHLVPDYRLVILSTVSELCATLMIDGRLLGVLVLERSYHNAFSDEDVAQVCGIAQTISLAIVRSQQRSDLRFQTMVATQSAWVAELAHDINRELKYIRKRAYFLKKGLSVDSRRDGQEIDESAARLAIAADTPYSSRKEDVEIDSWIKQQVEALVAGRNVEPEFELLCEGVHITTSPYVLTRVLGHLVRNAVEAMDGSSSDRRLEVKTYRKNEHFVEVQVSNNGEDIPDDVREKLFIERVSTKDSERGKGGLGLLFVRSALEQIGGTIKVLPPSSISRGAAFAFTLPVARTMPNKEKPYGVDNSIAR